MGPFEMVVLLVLITTIGKVVTHRRESLESRNAPPQLNPGDVESLREALDDLSGRVVRLEEERDFYKELLDAPERNKGLPGPGGADPS